MLYPLRFEPLFRRYLWGGHRLREVLGKQTGQEAAAESWELVDHGTDQSVVRFGPLAGTTLNQLIAQQGRDLLGDRVFGRVSSAQIPASLRGRFPLLLKFLDANRHLSIQVHPDDQFGATMDPPDLGKTEAWYVMDAAPGATIYAGVQPGIDRSAFAAAVEAGRTEEAMHRFQPSPGDCVFIPAGTMHAIGEGLLICEIQQASDTTFRVYDWGRLDADGNSRPLHIQRSLEVTRFEDGPVNPQIPQTIEPGVEELVRCDKFVLRRHQLDGSIRIGGDGRFRVLAVVDGEINVAGDPSGQPATRADTILIPASLPPVEITPSPASCSLLEIFTPDNES